MWASQRAGRMINVRSGSHARQGFSFLDTRVPGETGGHYLKAMGASLDP